MLAGRFLLIVPVLALAGSLARKQPVPPSAGTFPTDTPLFAVCCSAVILIVVGLTYFPVLALGPIVEQLASVSRQRPSMLDPRADGAVRRGDAVVKLDPRRMARQPGHVRGRGGQRRSCSSLADPRARPVFAWVIAVWLWFTVLFANFAEAMAEGRGKAQADALRRTRAETIAPPARRRRRLEEVPVQRARARRRGRGRGRRGHPGRRRGHRGHRQRRRVGDHRRVGAGHPRVGRRPLRGHRRHARALATGSSCASPQEPGRELPRPDDRAGRGRRAPEDAQRDRARHPAGRAHASSSCIAVRHAAAVRRLLRRARRTSSCSSRCSSASSRRRSAALLSAHRHRRHGPARAAQRARHLAAAPSRPPATVDTLLLDKTGTITLGNRQAVGVPPGCPASTSSELADAAQLVQPRRRDAGGPLDRGARQGALRPARARAAPARTLRPVHRADAHERRRHRRRAAIRKGAADAVAGWVDEHGGDDARRARRASSTASPSAGGTPLVVAETAARRSGVIQLKDVVKEGMRERFDELRRMGIRTVMITGDNPLTARGHRGRGRRRRLPRRGDARGQAGADPQRAGAAATSSR